ncbi:hypothetical protein BMS3Bbin04_01249 [bacterium BMS3Bbin04]|nr:hypothetical protein BMS3Bbin04_01249 [bacterium BMS3Bbin04]
MAPNYAMPSYSSTDEAGVGIRVFGRDPIGILSWNVAAHVGLESQMPNASANITYRDLPVDLSLSTFSYPDELLEANLDQNNSLIFDSVWKQEWDIGLTAFQRIHLDQGKWRTTALPFVGLTQRFRHRQTTLEGGLESNGYLGVRAGGTLIRSYSALRDPVPSRLELVRLTMERGFPGMDLEGDLIEINLRKHVPGPLTNTVVALKGAVQTQNGDLSFSRAGVRPRGYADDDLSTELRRNGRILFGGTELHFPLWYADHGLPGLGYLYLERVSGSLFAEGSTGWGGGVSLADWTNDYGVASLGGVLSMRGWLFFQADTRVDVGAAWRSEFDDVAIFVRLSFPELLDFIGDSPDWEQLVD